MKKLILLIFLLITVIQAQELQLTTRGVEGAGDKRKRDPQLEVRISNHSEGIQVTALAFVPNVDYQRFPISFDFYIGGKLFQSQLDSTNSPRTATFIVGSDIATAPFPYELVASVKHPNKVTTTILKATAFSNQLSASALGCDYTTSDGVTYEASNVALLQNGNSTVELSFKASNSESDKSISGVLTISGDSISGVLNTDATNSQTSLETFTGSVSTNSETNNIEAFAITSNKESSIDCEVEN